MISSKYDGRNGVYSFFAVVRNLEVQLPTCTPWFPLSMLKVHLVLLGGSLSLDVGVDTALEFEDAGVTVEVYRYMTYDGRASSAARGLIVTEVCA